MPKQAMLLVSWIFIASPTALSGMTTKHQSYLATMSNSASTLLKQYRDFQRIIDTFAEKTEAKKINMLFRIVDQEKQTPLSYALIHRMLHDRCVQTRLCTNELFTHILLGRDTTLLTTVLEAGLNPNERTDVSFYPPLITSSKKGDVRSIRVLLSHGAKPNLRSIFDMTALHYAAQEGHDKAVANLIAGGASVDDATLEGVTPLLLAADRGHTECVKILLKHQATQQVEGWGRTPAHQAAQNGHCEVLRLLLEQGAQPNAIDNNGISPLIPAAQYGQINCVRLLLSHGADACHRSNYGNTALEQAASYAHRACVRTILTCGQNVRLDINTLPCDGWPILHRTIYQGQTACALLFLQHGANPYYAINNVWTAHKVAKERNQPEIVRLIKEYYIYNGEQYKTLADLIVDEVAQQELPPSASFAAAAKLNLPTPALRTVFRHLIAAGTEISQNDKGYGTPLQQAFDLRAFNVIHALLDSGADPDQEDKFPGLSNVGLIHTAVLQGETKIVELLIQGGVNLQACTGEGYSPLHIAAYTGQERMVKLLLKHGGYTEQPDLYGTTAIDIAHQAGHNDIIEMLEEYRRKSLCPIRIMS